MKSAATTPTPPETLDIVDNDSTGEFGSEDQTSFGLEKPLFEAPPSFPSAVVDSPKPPMSQKKKILIGTGVGFGMLVLVLLLLMILTRSSMPDQLLPLPSAAPINRQVTPLEQKIKTLNQELDQADPTKQDLPFPPVDMEIRLDDPQKR